MITHLRASKLVILREKHVLLRIDPYLNTCPYFIDAIARCTETQITVHAFNEPMRISFIMKWRTEGGKSGWEVIDSMADMRVSTHIIVRLQRRWRSVLKEMRDRRTALCMGAHPRLGLRSPLHCIDRDLLRVIVGFM